MSLMVQNAAERFAVKSLIDGRCIVALHEPKSGPKRHIASPHNFGRIRIEAEMQDLRSLTAFVANDAVDNAYSVASKCHRVVALKRNRVEGASMSEVSAIGVDIAKSVFQIHDVDADGTVVICRRVSRGKVLEFFTNLSPCPVSMEACATAHRWARELKKLGRDTRLIPRSWRRPHMTQS